MKELYALSSDAFRDLVEIWNYIRRDDPDAPDRVQGELLEKCESLARMPGQGHRRADYTKALPGCVALGFTLEETKTLIREALDQHLAAMRADGDEIPEPSQVELVEVA